MPAAHRVESHWEYLVFGDRDTDRPLTTRQNTTVRHQGIPQNRNATRVGSFVIGHLTAEH
jgi:hypothetical protein